MADIFQAATASEIDAVRSLFREYEETLGLDLCFQGFEEELRTLPGKYAPPEGRLLIALIDGAPAGCIAMRPLGDGICEMKRLFVRETGRGQGLGRQLIVKLLAAVRYEGYERMRLDTYPAKMKMAVDLYREFGFAPIAAYYDNPDPKTLFMEAVL